MLMTAIAFTILITVLLVVWDMVTYNPNPDAGDFRRNPLGIVLLIVAVTVIEILAYCARP